MPYSFPGNVPRVAKNWTPAQQKKCTSAANAVLSGGGSEREAVFSCIRAAGKTKGAGPEKSDASTQWVDLFDAGRVLAGQEVLLVPVMPDGYVRGGVRRPPITEQDLRAMAANFQNRGASGFYQTRLPLNKEHESTEGKIGTIASFEVRADGGYAVFDLTEEGKALLQQAKFDYLSPEIRWDTTDVVTGEELGPTLVGAAVTNYPFFGDRTAMYSARAEEKLADDELPLDEFLEDFGEDAPDASDPDGEEGPGLQSVDVVALVRSAIEEVFAEMGVDPTRLLGGTTMPEGNAQNGEQGHEDYAARLTALEEAAETYRAAIAERDRLIADQGSRIATLTQERLMERFSHEAEAYSAIGADRSELAQNLMWLYTADTAEGRPHYTWFSSLLSTVNTGLAESVAFSEVGHSKDTGGSDPWKRIDAKVQALARSRNVSVREGTAAYSELMTEILSAEPELFAAYRQSLVG